MRPRRILSSEDARMMQFDNSAVYVQMPGDHVFTGALRRNRQRTNAVNIPRWMMGTPAPGEGRIFLFIPPSHTFHANMSVLVHQKNNTSVQGYTLFIKTIYSDYFKSHLLIDPPRPDDVTTPHIYVRMLDYNNVYGGKLEPIFWPNTPNWIL